MANIHVLDEKTINKIAAGEVVERPQSVVKELVENAVDAGATSLEVEIAEGGSTYIRVTDNGQGMTEEDARLAILRHATSKIRYVEDLFDISSLGFRGEALASISAVSHFVLTTRLRGAALGTRVMVDGGVLSDCSPCGTAEGTTIEVKDLFYNTPARKKFLKTNRTEGARILDMLGKLAISHAEIAFKVVVDGKVSLVTPGNGSLSDTVGALYGMHVVKDIFPVHYENDNVIVEGVVGKPSLLKSSRTWQTIIVNQRVVSDKVAFKALDNAYHALLPKGGYPLAILRIVVPPDMVDINVHPRKSEVKFADDKVIFSAVYRAVLNGLENKQEALGIATDIRGDVPSVRNLPPEEHFKGLAAKESSNRSSYSSSPNWREERSSLSTLSERKWEEKREEARELLRRIQEEEYRPPVQPKLEQERIAFSNEEWQQSETSISAKNESIEEPVAEEMGTRHARQFVPLGQVAECYILAKQEDDLFIIDQHAAHERIRYDRLCKSHDNIPSQELLIPLIGNATPEELAMVEEEEELFLNLGFTVALGGPKQYRVDAIPADIVESKGEEILRFIFEQLLEGAKPTPAQLRHEMLAYASCRGAIKAGHILNLYQMSVLIDELFQTEKPYVCPHGRPTMIRFTPEELAKLFLRT